MSEKKTLYHKNKNGKVCIWRVWTEGNEILTEHGQEDGQLVVTPKVCSGKNIGRSNETTPEEQAEKEMQSMIQKKLDGKYCETKEEIDQFRLAPMLADNFNKRKSEMNYSDKVTVQQKLDGSRCMAYWLNGKIELMSRGGKPINLPHIKEKLESILPEWAILDGEIYNHDIGFQEIMRLTKKLRDNSSDLNYHVYDILNKDDMKAVWKDRSKMLKETVPSNDSDIKLVESIECGSEKKVMEAVAEFISQGYEGGIARTKSGIYMPGHRSKDLLKIKVFVDKEYKIVGFTRWESRVVEGGKPKMIKCVRYTCETEDGKQFGVVPKGNVYERNEMLKSAPKDIGKMLTVKFFELSDEGIPRFPVGLGIRDVNIQG